MENVRTRKRILTVLLGLILIMQNLFPVGFTYAAEGDDACKLILNAGVSNMPVFLSYDCLENSGKTNGSGDYKAEDLYNYLTKDLGWGSETDPTTKEITVEYSLNIPGAASPEERQKLGGRIEYKGRTGSFTLKYDEDWNKEIKLDSPDKMEKLEGTVKTIPFGKTVSDAKNASGETIKFSNGKTVKTDSNGDFIVYGISKETDPNLYLTIEANDDHPELKVQLKNAANTLYLRNRPEVKQSDYEIEGAYNYFVGSPEKDTEYQIRGTGSNKVSLTRDGEGKDSVNVTLNKDGSQTPFYVIKDGISSNKVENAIKIDTTAPDLTDITTSAAKEVKIKKHGIYSKQKAELLITVKVSDKESGVKKLQLAGKNSEGTTYYDTSKVTNENGVTTATFVIESKEELLKQVLSLTAYDNVGNKSKDVLIRGSEEKSEITMEIIPPKIGAIEVVKGKINKNGWYKEPLSFEVKTSDLESGMESVNVTTNNSYSLYSKDYDEKALGERRAGFSLTKETIENEKNKDGSYKILVKAVDNSGNITAKSMNVKVDLVAPKLDMTGVKKGSYLKKAPTLKIKEDEEYYSAKGNYFTATVTRDGKKHYVKTFSRTNAATIASSVFSKDGNYKVSVSGEDAAGNKTNVVKTDFVKDATAPAVSIKGPDHNKYYNKAQTSTITVKERNYKTDDVHITVTRKLGKKTSKVSFPWRNKGVTSAASKKFSATGTYTVSVYAVDKAGNRSQTKTAKFTVDTVAPKLTIKGISNDKTYQFKDAVAPVITFSDDYLAGKKVTLTRAGQNWYDKLAKTSGSGSVKFSDFAKKKENDGLYVLTVEVSDKAGNKTRKKVEFTVNRFGSSFKYGETLKALRGKTVQNVEDNLSITEYNVSKLKKTTSEVRRDGEVLDTEGKTTELSKKNGSRVYLHRYNSDLFDKEGVYELNILSKDTAGNKMESKSENGVVKFTVDRTAPTLSVSGYEKINKADSVTLKINTQDSLSKPTIAISVDGRDILPDKTEDGYEVTLKKGTNQNVKVTVMDQAGNSKTFDESISVVPNGFLYFILKYKMLLIAAAILIIAAVGFFVQKRRKKKVS